MAAGGGFHIKSPLLEVEHAAEHKLQVIAVTLVPFISQRHGGTGLSGVRKQSSTSAVGGSHRKAADYQRAGCIDFQVSLSHSNFLVQEFRPIAGVKGWRRVNSKPRVSSTTA